MNNSDYENFFCLKCNESHEHHILQRDFNGYAVLVECSGCGLTYEDEEDN